MHFYKKFFLIFLLSFFSILLSTESVFGEVCKCENNNFSCSDGYFLMQDPKYQQSGCYYSSEGKRRDPPEYFQLCFKNCNNQYYSCCEKVNKYCQEEGKSCKVDNLDGICTKEKNQLFCKVSSSLDDGGEQFIKTCSTIPNGRYAEPDIYVNASQDTPCTSSEYLGMSSTNIQRSIFGSVFVSRYCCVLKDEGALSPDGTFIKRCNNGGGILIIRENKDAEACSGRDNAIININIPQPWKSRTNQDYYFCCKKSTSEIFDDSFVAPSTITVDPNIISLTQDNLNKINPLTGSVNFGTREKRTPANIINVAMRKVVFPLAGSLLFLLLIIGGYQILSASLTGKQNYIEIGKQRVTSAIIGFILLFATYWLWRILMIALGIQ